MAKWSTRGAVRLFHPPAGGYIGYLRNTSTSTGTLLVETSATTWVLRMWGIRAENFTESFRYYGYPKRFYDSGAGTNQATVHDYTTVTQWLCYLDSLPGMGRFTVNSTDTNPTSETTIPFERRNVTTSLELVTGIVSRPGADRMVTATLAAATGSVFYKDPCVRKVPASLGGGYVMILTRYRLISALGGTDISNCSPGKSIADVVCFYSRDGAPPTFSETHGATGDIRGPFLLVDSLRALRDPATGDWVPFRPWLGVAGAAFVGTELFLYYVAHPNTLTDVDPPYADTCSAASYRAEVDAFNDGAGLECEIVFRRISADTVRNQIVGATPPAEYSWTSADALPGDVNLPARFWMARRGVPHQVYCMKDRVIDTFRSRSTTPVTVEARFLDPAPIVSGGRLGLCVAIRPRMPDDLVDVAYTMHGIWLFRAVKDSAVPYLWHASNIAVVFGLDFVVADAEFDWSSALPAWKDGDIFPDRVAAAGYDASSSDPITDLADPDPARVPLTFFGITWWQVYTHDHNMLVVCETDEADLDLDPSTAWGGSGLPVSLDGYAP